MSSDDPLSRRLGYLLKHAALRLEKLHAEALAPFDVDGRELGVLFVIAGPEPLSQQQVAQRLGVDRTTMVAMLDTLERRGLLSRNPHPEDRRRNMVELTDHGKRTFRDATKASDKAERSLLASLTQHDATQLRAALHQIVTSPDAAER